MRRPGRYLLLFSFWVRSVQNHRPFSKRLLDDKRKPLPELLAPGRRVEPGAGPFSPSGRPGPRCTEAPGQGVSQSCRQRGPFT